jgi:hypothetical protein
MRHLSVSQPALIIIQSRVHRKNEAILMVGHTPAITDYGPPAADGD